MNVSSWTFAAFVVFSGVLVFAFYRGVKINVKRARELASILEEVLKPEDQTYTWLGGVIGFSAEYRGDVGKEPMIRVLGKDAKDVVFKVEKILQILD